MVTKFLPTGNPLSTNPAKWSNTLKQFVGQPTNCLIVFDHFVGLALKRLIYESRIFEIGFFYAKIVKEMKKEVLGEKKQFLS